MPALLLGLLEDGAYAPNLLVNSVDFIQESFEDLGVTDIDALQLTVDPFYLARMTAIVQGFQLAQLKYAPNATFLEVLEEGTLTEIAETVKALGHSEDLANDLINNFQLSAQVTEELRNSL
jgi:hypothetical protein